MMKKKRIKLRIQWYLVLSMIVVILLSIFMTAFYIIKVGNHVSSDTATWGQFGDYFNLIINIINTSGVLLLGYFVYQAQKRRDEWERHYSAAQEKPLLRFVAWEGAVYRLYNMGKGPAHKVIFGKIQTGDSNITLPTFKGYSIPANAYLDINWTSSASILYAFY